MGLHFLTSFHPQHRLVSRTRQFLTRLIFNEIYKCGLKVLRQTPRNKDILLQFSNKWVHQLHSILVGEYPKTLNSIFVTCSFWWKDFGTLQSFQKIGEKTYHSQVLLRQGNQKDEEFVDCNWFSTDNHVGDIVLMKFNPRLFKAQRGIYQNLLWKYEGPLKIIAR